MTLAFFACAIVAMLFVACCAREERAAVIWAAVIVALNWLSFASYWIYAPLSPAYLIYDAAMAWGVKLPVKLTDVWAVTDLISLMAIYRKCGQLWWSAMFIATYLATLTMLSVAYAIGCEYLEYRLFLDACLIIQIGTIFMLGGDGCADYLSSQWRVCRSYMVVRTPVDNPQGSKQ